jgi:two-component system NarL family sensor kinase
VKAAGRRRSSRAASSRVLTELRARLDEAEQTLSAIRSGGVDALVVGSEEGPRVYTLEGADHVYRLLIESMNEGALILSAAALILYANQRFARMLKRPLARVIGQPFQQFLPSEARRSLKSLLNGAMTPPSTIQVLLQTADRVRMPAQVSVQRLAKAGPDGAAFGMVVTDMTEARRSEALLRSLSRSLLQGQEADRRRLAGELHDRASQSLGALLISLRVLGDDLPVRSKALRKEVAAISEMVGRTADVVESISRNLRPSVLEILGLVPAVHATVAEFAKRTGLTVKIDCARVSTRLSPEAEMVLFRTLEEALKNVEKHADARNATVQLGQKGAVMRLMIGDDGVGFDSGHHLTGGNGNGKMGLIGLRERVVSVGGALKIKSTRGDGTEIEARIPLPRGAAARLLDR